MKSLVEQLTIEYVRCTETGLESRMKLGPFHAQPFGYLNGGATIAFCEAIAGMASNEIERGEYLGPGQSVTAHHVRPKKAEGTVTAIGELLHRGKRSHVWSIRVVDEEDRLISQVTFVKALIAAN